MVECGMPKSPEEWRALKAERRRSGLCESCGRPKQAAGWVCDDCRDRRAASGRRRRATRRANGLCGDCGTPADGSTLCVTCREGDRQNRAGHVARRRTSGSCVCGEMLLPGGATCAECWYRHKAQKKLGSRGLGVAIKILLECQGFRCAYSGKPLKVGDPDTTLDHKIPRARGGSNELSNLQWVSKRVNQMKTDFTHDEFIRACQVIAARFAAPLKKTA